MQAGCNMKKETREKKFKCPYGETDIKQYTMNCHYFGCIHKINDDCPIVKRQAQGGDK